MVLNETSTAIVSIDELQGQGINASDIQKLRAAGICSITSVLSTTRRNLLKIRGLSEIKVEKIKEAAGKIVVSFERSSGQTSSTSLLIIFL